MKKYILIVLILLVTTGCSVEYNLFIDDSTITEDVTLISENQDDSKRIVDFIEPVSAFYDTLIDSETFTKKAGIEYYKEKKITNGEFVNYNLKYDFSYSNFKKSRILNNEISLFKFKQKNGVYFIETGAEIFAFNKYNKISHLLVNVHISDDIEIISTNAHNVVNNKLTWDLYDNYNPISVAFKINKKAENDRTPINQTGGNNASSTKIDLSNHINSTIVIILSILLFFILLFIVMKFRGKNRR